MITKQKIYLVVLGLCLLLACLPMQQVMGSQLAEMLKLTLTVYALARGLNAVISVAQGTEMSIEPMGVGLTLTPGEVLDPLNDLIEQVAVILLMASASLGIQNILLGLGDHFSLRIVLVTLIILTIFLLLMRGIKPKIKQVCIKLVIVLTLVRLLVPVTTLVSHQLQDWLVNERQQALTTLTTAREEIDSLNNANTETDQSWFEGFKDRLDIQLKLNQLRQHTEQSVEAAIYVLAEFILIMVLLPLLFLFLMFKLSVMIRL
jgi:hypothetical protein